MRVRPFVTSLLLAAFALSACTSLPIIGELGDLGLNVGDIAQIGATPVAFDPAVKATAAPASISTAALVKQRSKIRVGIRFDAPPLSRVNADGELEGMDVDLARDFARRWLGSERNVEFVQVTSQTAPQKIRNREIDLAMGGLVHTKRAEQDADFSLAYVKDGEALLTRTGTFSDFLGMAGRTITYIDSPSTFALADAQIANNITITLNSQNSYRAAVDALLAGETDGVAGRWRRLRATASSDPALAILTVLTNEPVAIMTPQNDSAWIDLINQTLSTQMQDGTFAQLYEKWFGAPPDPITVLSQPAPPQLADLPNGVAVRDALTTMRASNAVRVAFISSSPPFATVDANGQPDGFEVDLVREMARRWFGDPNAAQFTALTLEQIPAALNGGTIDIAIGGIQHTGPAAQGMDFSETTFVSSGLPIGMALPQNDSGLRDLVNLTLQEMQTDGTYSRTFQKWFPDQPVNEIEHWPGVSPALQSLLAGPTSTPEPTQTPAP
jgi:putative glutamine transport system substrate-binding protein